LNVVLLHHAAHPVVGGVENVMREHARLFAGAGHQVRVIAGRGEQVDPGIVFNGVPLVDSRAPEILEAKAALDTGVVPPDFENLANRIVAALRPLIADADVVLAHNVCSLNKNLALTAALKYLAEASGRPRFVLWHHDLAWTTPRYRPELHEGFPWDLLRTDWPEVTQVTVSRRRQIELAGLLRVSKERIKVIPNGIDFGRFLGLGALTETLMRGFQLAEAAPLILLPVRITRRKNIEMALRVTAQLRARFALAKMVVTGPVGPHNPANLQYLDSLVALRRELDLEASAVFLTIAAGKSIPDAVVADLYRLADLVLLPSIEEGFGIPVLEAGLAGIPVFCSDIETLRELGGPDASYFAPDGDAQAVARQIGETLGASPRYALRKRVLQEYAWERVYERHIAPLLESL
jgi:glycosyltransferase involved in cell wall biosynthesis